MGSNMLITQLYYSCHNPLLKFSNGLYILQILCCNSSTREVKEVNTSQQFNSVATTAVSWVMPAS